MTAGSSPARVSVEGMALSKLIKLGPGGDPCWLWRGSLTAAGYPRKRWFNRELSARRWMYSLLLGIIPVRRVLEAKCGERLCVNPFHMKVVKMADAQRSGDAAKLVPGDVDDMRRRLADPRCTGRAFLNTLICSITEEYGLSRDYTVDLLGNRHHVDPALPRGIRNVIDHYERNPQCASTFSPSTTTATNTPTPAAAPTKNSQKRSAASARSAARRDGASTSCATA